MSISTTMLTAEQSRVVRDAEPSFSNRQGIDLPTLLNDFAAEVSAAGDVRDVQDALLISGVGTILNGATTVVIAVGAEFDGAFAVVSFGEAPASTVLVWSGVVASGNLTITADQDNTADLDVNYILDAR